MRILDASSIIYGWDNYPIEQFPKLWDWIATEIEVGDIAIAQVAFKEVKHKTPECGEWLNNMEITVIPASNSILRSAVKIQGLLGISNDDYHVNGVGENDIIIISTAKNENCELISNESIQNILPGNIKKYKIPAVCDLTGIGVRHLDFVQYLKQSKEMFG